jgi:hypothetical protein
MLWIGLLLASCDDTKKKKTEVIDVGAGPDLFQAMDGGIQLSAAEIKGRNAWHLWTAGNDAFWDKVARITHGDVDLLKTLDSRGHDSRFADLGLMNEPGYRKASKADEFGVWLDEPEKAHSPEMDPKIYGRSSGVLGFRIFPNPEFAGEKRKAWDAQRYYNDPHYLKEQPDLVRPYRVGVSCSACHVGPHPLFPPADPARPDWKNLASVIGNQYLNEGRVFAAGAKPGTFFWEMLNAQPRGTSDTSRLATDHLNNPGAINSIFLLNQRPGHEEALSGETLCLPGTNPRMKVPRILKDGADSVGFIGAALRVYVNTGLFHEHWLETHQLLWGITKQRPFSTCRARDESAEWRATASMLPSLASFFARLEPMHLADAPGGMEYINRDQAILNQGRTVFAQHCAGCHSSRQPPAGTDANAWFLSQSADPGFWKDNFLSDGIRHPLDVVKTNASRAFATNATEGHVWQWFSSDTYKSLPSPTPGTFWNPYSEQEEELRVPGGGRGYYRTPSLISIWATAPFLHNNSLGRFTGDPSVKGRVEAFQDAIEKLLWPEKRLNRDSIWRTSAESQIEVPGEYIPEEIRKLLGMEIDSDGIFRLGPIPKGTPINLLANVDFDGDPRELVSLAVKIREVLRQIRDQRLDPDTTRSLMRRELAPMLIKLSKCPDLIEDRGHLFGTKLPDAEKLALIEFLKTL